MSWRGKGLAGAGWMASIALAWILYGVSGGSEVASISNANRSTTPPPADQTAATHRVYLPLISRDVCQPIPGASYETFWVINPVSFNVADNPDYNLLLLGYVPVNEYKGLVDYGGEFDPNAPQFRFLFGDHRIPVFSNVYKNNGWDWENHRRLPPPPGWPPVSIAGFAVSPGEVIYVPDSGYDIGNGFDALVLYADPQQLTLKYTGEDSTVWGYTVYITGICVEPSLLALYQQWNANGRWRLPVM